MARTHPDRLVAGLDQRLGWSAAVAAPWQLAGLVGVVGESLLTTGAMVVNHFFAATVRIQQERG